MTTVEICGICRDESDLLVACRVCKRNGMCLDCERQVEKCPFCRARIRTVITLDLSNLPQNSYHGVESILDYRMLENGDEEFLVMWTDAEPTWEPALTMWEDIPEMCEEYFQQNQ